MSHGASTIPEVVDRLAIDTPEKTWLQFIASQKDLEEGVLTSVTYGTLANAINRVAWFLSRNVPRAGSLETTICYIAPSDIRYFIVACAATKARVKLLLSSPRNNFEAHAALFEQTECRTLLGPAGLCKELSDAYGMEHIDMLTMEMVLDREPVEAYPWHRTLQEVASEPFVILHTSGSTGQPKMVKVTHALVATIDAQQDLPKVKGRCVTSQMWKDCKLYAAMPLFHSAGFNILAFSIFQGTQPVLGPSDQPPSVRTVEQILDMGVAAAGLIPPSLLAEIAEEPTVLQKLSNWSSVSYGGGPLAEEAMKSIFKHTKILKLLGSTETFNLPELLPESEDELAYHYFHPSLRIEFRPEGLLHELVFVREEGSKHQGAFLTFPDLKEYRMKDLYERHPTKDGMWKYKGRLDDIIVLSNGEKFNPRAAEAVLSAHPAVQSALIVGCRRDQPLLLVEPRSGIDASAELDMSEPLRRAHEILPDHAKIHTSHIHIVEAGSFLRSGKGEVRRGPTIDKLQGEIEAAYKVAEDRVTANIRLDFSSEDAIASSLLSVITSEILPGRDVAPTDDLFSHGLDSLAVMHLTRLIKSSIRDQGVDVACRITPKLIYNQRTAANIASSMMPGSEQSTNDAGSQHCRMQQCLDSHLNQLPQTPSIETPKLMTPERVYLLTGSTGSLGSYLLDSLLRQQSTTKVICLNRRGGNAAKQKKIQHSRGLTEDFSRVVFLEGQLAKVRFGLDEEQYSILQETTHIVHNAWQVNFNLPLAAFDDQLQGCRRLIELADSARHTVALTFLSSIGAANHWLQTGNEGPVPEAIIHDFDAAESGYGQSKLLAEHLFATANERLGLPVTICRMGQIAGPVKSSKGMWNTHEWFPSLMLSSKEMRMLPETLGSMDRVDWIPVDTLADILALDIVVGSDEVHIPPTQSERVMGEARISTDSAIPRSGTTTPVSVDSTSSTPASSLCSSMEVLGLKTRHPLAVRHFVNPFTAHWQGNLACQAQRILGHDVMSVPFSEWVEALSAHADQDDAATRQVLPAAKLLDFFQDVAGADSKRPLFSLEQSAMASKSLMTLEAVSADWLEQWWDQWSGLDDDVKSLSVQDYKILASKRSSCGLKEETRLGRFLEFAYNTTNTYWTPTLWLRNLLSRTSERIPTSSIS